MRNVDVLIPTLRRPDNLARALRSVFAQAKVREIVAAIVVVDNSPEGSASASINALRPAAPVPLVYVHEPKPGVATARNAGLAASDAPYVAFLDDDEEAPPHWLTALRAAHLELGSAVTFGPVRGLAPDAKPAHRAHLDRFFSREGGDETTLIDIPFGCGNSMMTRAIALAEVEPFDTRADLTGGEDDRLFTRLRVEGMRFGWAAQAWVHEYAPAHRARLGYALKRAFCFGQSPSQIRWRTGRWGGLALTMLIGAGQAVVYGGVALSLLAVRRESVAAKFLDRMVRGLGKVFWFLRIQLYGLNASPAPLTPPSAFTTAGGGVGISPPFRPASS